MLEGGISISGDPSSHSSHPKMRPPLHTIRYFCKPLNKRFLNLFIPQILQEGFCKWSDPVGKYASKSGISDIQRCKNQQTWQIYLCHSFQRFINSTKYLLIIILQNVSLLSCYLFTKGIHFIGEEAQCQHILNSMINVYRQNMPLPSELIPISRAPVYREPYA